MSVIIFSDMEQNLYLLRVEEKDIICNKIHKQDKAITRIQMDQENNIVLVT
jgi:hypothetical protein